MKIRKDLSRGEIVLTIDQPTGNELEQRLPATLAGWSVILRILDARAHHDAAALSGFVPPASLGRDANPTAAQIDAMIKNFSRKREEQESIVSNWADKIAAEIDLDINL